MKKLIIALAAILAITIALPACTGVEAVSTNSLEFTNFDRVEVGSAFQVDVVQGDQFSVNVTATQRVLDHLNVTQDGTVLKIGLDGGVWGWVPWNMGRPKARITMPQLYSLKVTGASKANVTGFESTHDSNFTVSGASSLDVDVEAGNSTVEVDGASHMTGRLVVQGATIRIEGASRAELSGDGHTLDLKASGASRAEMENLTVGDASVKLSGASRATVSPTGKINVALSGASSLQYTGSPSLEGIDVSGASTIHRK